MKPTQEPFVLSFTVHRNMCMRAVRKDISNMCMIMGFSPGSYEIYTKKTFVEQGNLKNKVSIIMNKPGMIDFFKEEINYRFKVGDWIK